MTRSASLKIYNCFMLQGGPYQSLFASAPPSRPEVGSKNDQHLLGQQILQFSFSAGECLQPRGLSHRHASDLGIYSLRRCLRTCRACNTDRLTKHLPRARLECPLSIGPGISLVSIPVHSLVWTLVATGGEIPFHVNYRDGTRISSDPHQVLYHSKKCDFFAVFAQNGILIQANGLHAAVEV